MPPRCSPGIALNAARPIEASTLDQVVQLAVADSQHRVCSPNSSGPTEPPPTGVRRSVLAASANNSSAAASTRHGSSTRPLVDWADMGFFEQLRRSWTVSNSLLCVGLDPSPERLPKGLGVGGPAVFRFCKEIVDATADVVCAFKPQIAHFASQGAEAELEQVCRYIREQYPDVTLVLDAKRGDIGSTASTTPAKRSSATAPMRPPSTPISGSTRSSVLRSRRWSAGRMSHRNASGDAIQSLDCGGRPLYMHVAELVAERWAQLGDCGLVVGATYPAELAAVRRCVGDLPILVPGVGAQGGDPRSAVAAAATSDGRGLLISASRSILYAGSGTDFAAAARQEAIETRLHALPAGW